MSEFEQFPNIQTPQPARRARPKLPRWPNTVLLVFLGLFLFCAGLLTGWYWRGGEPAAAVAAVVPGQPPLMEDTATGQLPAQAVQEEPSNQIQIPEELTRYDVNRDDLPALGPADAPIVLVEFSDYQCPYCKRWHDDVLPRLVAEYGDKIKFVYRNLPVIRPNSADAAQASYCADEQGAYWEYHEALFTYQYDFNDQAYEQYARDLGLDAEALMECYRSGRYALTVDEDLQFARSLGIGSTPTFFLNGIPIVGAQPYDIFKQIIDLELAGELP